MPTYQYACTACDERLEAVQSFSDAPLTECPACGGALRKVFSAVGVVFKGSGFYKTDSRSSKGDGATTAGKAEGGSSDSSSGGSSDSSSGAGSSSGSGDKPAAPAAKTGSSDSGTSSSSSSSTSTPASKSA